MNRLVLPVLGATLLLPTATATGQPDARARSAACVKAPAPLISSLKSGMKAKARSKLRVAKAVKEPGVSTAPRDFRSSIYFVSAKLPGFGIATWGVSPGAFRTGGGLIVGIGNTARAVSTFGVDIPKSTLSYWGLATSAPGYAASRACVS